MLNADGSRPTGVVTTVDTGLCGELPSPGEIVTKWFVLLGGILLLGAPLFHLLIVPAGKNPRRKNNDLLETLSRNLVLRVVWGAALAIALSSILQVVFQAFRVGGLTQLPNSLFGTRTGTLGLIRLVLASTRLFIVLGLPQPRPLTEHEWPAF